MLAAGLLSRQAGGEVEVRYHGNLESSLMINGQGQRRTKETETDGGASLR